MKLKELIEKADSLFNSEEKDRKQRKKSIKAVLKKLRKRQIELNEKLCGDELDAESKEKIEQKLALTKMHRKNGIEILRKIKAETAAS